MTYAQNIRQLAEIVVTMRPDWALGYVEKTLKDFVAQSAKDGVFPTMGRVLDIAAAACQEDGAAPGVLLSEKFRLTPEKRDAVTV